MKNPPKDILESQAMLFSHGIEERSIQSIEYIQSKFEKKELIYLAIRFINNILIDGFKCNIDSLARIGFFPASEIQKELQDALNQALTGSYRHAYDSLRRAIEFICVAIYLTSEHVTKKEAIKWFESKSHTPRFTTIVKKIAILARFQEFDMKFMWKENIQSLYWKLCDVIHINGFEMSSFKFDIGCHTINGVRLPQISKETLSEFLNSYIRVVSEIICILALYNPIILVGLPLDQKFGFNSPISGFFYEGQSQILNDLIPTKFKAFFQNIAQNDEEVINLLKWFNSHNDITDAKLEKQIKELKIDSN